MSQKTVLNYTRCAEDILRASLTDAQRAAAEPAIAHLLRLIAGMQDSLERTHDALHEATKRVLVQSGVTVIETP